MFKCISWILNFICCTIFMTLLVVLRVQIREPWQSSNFQCDFKALDGQVWAIKKFFNRFRRFFLSLFCWSANQAKLRLHSYYVLQKLFWGVYNSLHCPRWWWFEQFSNSLLLLKCSTKTPWCESTLSKGGNFSHFINKITQIFLFSIHPFPKWKILMLTGPGVFQVARWETNLTMGMMISGIG